MGTFVWDCHKIKSIPFIRYKFSLDDNLSRCSEDLKLLPRGSNSSCQRPKQGFHTQISDKSNKMSGGVIFLLLLLLFLFLYLGVGSFIKWKFFGAEGVEMIPNWEFWSTLSSNLKDCCLFLVNGCRSNRRGAYEEIWGSFRVHFDKEECTSKDANSTKSAIFIQFVKKSSFIPSQHIAPAFSIVVQVWKDLSSPKRAC